jgi:GT2 family glycosyltransferase
MSVAVIVLNWNGGDDTLGCLDALDRLDLAGTVEHLAVLVLDNASTDGSDRRIRAERPDIPFISTGANLGYAGGNNVGIRRAIESGVGYVWVLNNDARPRPDALAELLSVWQPGLGMASSRAEPPFGTAFWAGEELRCQGCEVGLHPADRVVGASLFFDADLFRTVGYFDERYFHYAEDDDLAIRAQRGGWRLGFACRSVIDHDAGSSLAHWSPQASYYMVRNRALLDRRHFDASLVGWAFRHRSDLWAHLAPRRSLQERNARRAVAIALALGDVARGRVGRRDLGPRYQGALLDAGLARGRDAAHDG